MKNKVCETVRHLINRNIMSSLTDQALIGKINLLKSTLVEMSRQSQAALTTRFLLVDKLFRGWHWYSLSEAEDR